MSWTERVVAITGLPEEIHPPSGGVTGTVAESGVEEWLALAVDGETTVWASGDGAEEGLIELGRSRGGRKIEPNDLTVVRGRDAIGYLVETVRRDRDGVVAAVRRARREGRLDGPLDRAAFHAVRAGTESEGENVDGVDVADDATVERIRRHCEAIRRRECERAIRTAASAGDLTRAQRRAIRGLSAGLTDDLVRTVAGRVASTGDDAASTVADLLDVEVADTAGDDREHPSTTDRTPAIRGRP